MLSSASPDAMFVSYSLLHDFNELLSYLKRPELPNTKTASTSHNHADYVPFKIQTLTPTVD